MTYDSYLNFCHDFGMSNMHAGMFESFEFDFLSIYPKTLRTHTQEQDTNLRNYLASFANRTDYRLCLIRTERVSVLWNLTGR